MTDRPTVPPDRTARDPGHVSRVPAAVADSPAVARLRAAVLGAAGIDTHIPNEIASDMLPHMTLALNRGGVQVLVVASDLPGEFLQRTGEITR